MQLQYEYDAIMDGQRDPGFLRPAMHAGRLSWMVYITSYAAMKRSRWSGIKMAVVNNSALLAFVSSKIPRFLQCDFTFLNQKEWMTMEKMLVGMKQLYVDIYLVSFLLSYIFFILCHYNLVGSILQLSPSDEKRDNEVVIQECMQNFATKDFIMEPDIFSNIRR